MVTFSKKGSEYILALGGGGARGLAHIGVLKVLQKEGIKIRAIVGTSMGSVIGGMYAYYGDAIEVEEVFRKFFLSNFHEKIGRTFFLLSEDQNALHEPGNVVKKFGRSVIYFKAASSGSVLSRGILEETIGFLLPDIRFKDLQIPFACVAADLVTGKEVILNEGRILPAVVASSSIPGIVEPLRIGNALLVDGSVTGTVPVLAARKTFSGKVVAVDVAMDLKRDQELGTAFEVALRADEITNYYLNRVWLSEADVVIHPKVGRTNWANFNKLDEMVSAGETAAKKVLTQLNKRN